MNSSLKKQSTKFELLPRQRQAVDEIKVKIQNKEINGILLFADAGAGKTAMSLSAAKELGYKKILIITTATLKQNWKREVELWYPELNVEVADKFLPTTPSCIVHYNQLDKIRDELRNRKWDLIIVDESQYLKTPDSQRTVLVYGGWIKKKKIKKEFIEALKPKKWILLSGTPADRNRDLYTSIKICKPTGVAHSKFAFDRRYCGARKTNFGWDNSLSTNTDELVERMSDFTVRVPLKEIITLPDTTLKTTILPKIQPIVDAEEQVIREVFMSFVDSFSEETDKIEQVREIVGSSITELKKGVKGDLKVAFEEISKVRAELSHLKLPYICDLIEDNYDDDEQLVIFGLYKSLLRELYNYLGGPETCSIIDGSVPVKKRQAEIDKFKEGQTKYFLGNMYSAGEGLTLVTSKEMLIIDLPYNYTTLAQVMARINRIGQKRETNINMILVDGTIDTSAFATLSRKETNFLKYSNQ